MAIDSILGIEERPTCPRHGAEGAWHGDYAGSGVGSFICPAGGEVIGPAPRVRHCRTCRSLVVVEDDWTCIVCHGAIPEPAP